jgi:hypothetical protein
MNRYLVGIRQQGELNSDHSVACFKCGTESNLMMLAHMNDNKVVGWLFACDKCALGLLDKTLKD